MYGMKIETEELTQLQIASEAPKPQSTEFEPPSTQPRQQLEPEPTQPRRGLSTPEGRAARDRAIAEALGAGVRVVQKQEVLLNAERHRQQCEDTLVAAEVTLNSNMDALDGDLALFNQAMSRVNDVFTTPTTRRVINSPPSTPFGFHMPSSPPSTPSTNRTMTPATTPSKRPGGVIVMEPASPLVGTVHPGNRLPAYVVYHGKDNAHGVFESWVSCGDLPYAKSIADLNVVGDAIFRGFRNLNMARQYYQEALRDGIIAILNTPRLSPDEQYIVTKGVRPGVYSQRGILMKTGLQWRSGEVTVMVGTSAAGRAQFREWMAQGLVQAYPTDINERDI